jgi:hypothetical protein
MRKYWKHSVVAFLVIFLLAASVRVLYVRVSLPKNGNGAGAGAEMERAAVSLARTGQLASVYDDETGPSAHVAPLYPYYLALVYRVFGLPGDSGRLAQQLLSVLIVALSIALLPLLARRLRLSPWTGLAAAIGMALAPLNLWIECSGSWEQPVSALALLGLVFAFAVLHDREWRSSWMVCLTGLLVGILALLSPSLLPVVAIAIAGEWLVQSGRTRVFVGSLAIAVVAGVCVAPWMVRNHVAIGNACLRSNFGLELWVGNNPSANGKTFGTHAEDPRNLLYAIHPYSNAGERARLKVIGEAAYMREKQAQAVAWITAHPGEFARLCLRRVQIFWFPSADLWPPSTPAREMKAAIWSLTGLGTIVGLLLLLVRRHPHAVLLLSAAIGPSLVYLITHVDSRYRYPIFAVSLLLCFEAVHQLLYWANRLLTSVRSRYTNRTATVGAELGSF